MVLYVCMNIKFCKSVARLIKLCHDGTSLVQMHKVLVFVNSQCGYITKTPIFPTVRTAHGVSHEKCMDGHAKLQYVYIL